MKHRIDRLMVDRGLAQSRERARALVMEGKVLVNDMPVAKAGSMIDESAAIRLRGEDIPYVGRGGLKLAAALEHFNVNAEAKTAMDVGASTGGFTDCLLKRGAKKVYAIDVGYGQFDWRLRRDSRVALMERTNIRHMQRNAITGQVDIAAIDVSFISLKLVIAKVLEFLRPGGELIALIKPQFEVGRSDVGKGGIVRDEGKRLKAVEDVRAAFEEAGLRAVGVMESPIEGQKGNIEYLIYCIKERE